MNNINDTMKHREKEMQIAEEKPSTTTDSNSSVTSDSDSTSEGEETNNQQTTTTERELVEGEPGTLTGRPLRLYADGIFDLFHFGHAKALQQCKQAYPNVYLLVGCCNDELTHKLKGRTVMTDKERYESLRHCKWVDEVIEDAPWVITDEFLEKHQIDYVCHDALPYSDSSGESPEGDVYMHLKAIGKFHETQRTDGISTSDLITRIVSEYDMFVRRNLARGYTGKEMNVPFMKEQSIKFDMAVDKVKHDVDEFLQGFVGVFRRDGPLRTTIRERRKSITDLFPVPSPDKNKRTTRQSL